MFICVQVLLGVTTIGTKWVHKDLNLRWGLFYLTVVFQEVIPQKLSKFNFSYLLSKLFLI